MYSAMNCDAINSRGGLNGFSNGHEPIIVLWFLLTGSGSACRAAEVRAVTNELLVLTEKRYVDWLPRELPPRGKRYRVL